MTLLGTIARKRCRMALGAKLSKVKIKSLIEKFHAQYTIPDDVQVVFSTNLNDLDRR